MPLIRRMEPMAMKISSPKNSADIVGRGGMGADEMARRVVERPAMCFGGGFRHRRDQRPHHLRLSADLKSERDRDLPKEKIDQTEAVRWWPRVFCRSGSAPLLQACAFEQPDNRQHQEHDADEPALVERLARAPRSCRPAIICPARPVTKAAAAITRSGFSRSTKPRMTTPTPSKVSMSPPRMHASS